MKKRDLFISIILGMFCFVGGLFVLPYQFESLQKTLPEQYDILIDSMPMPFFVLIIISALQLAVISFVVAFIGTKLARRTGFSLSILDSLVNKVRLQFDKRSVLLAIVFGIITAFLITGADRFYFQSQIAKLGEVQPEFSLFGLLAGVFYGGVFEEILLRLFVMSLLVWIMMKILKNKNLSNVYYWIAIVIASLLFAAGHLPATNLLFGGLTTELIVRCFLLNGVGGLFFGYLYWKKGFEYAVIAHMFAHISLQLLFIPIFY